MIRELGGGSDLPPGVTGVTRLMVIGAEVRTWLLFATGPPPVPLELMTTVTVPVFAPGGRSVGLTVTVIVVPLVGTVPDVGLMVMNGWSAVAVKFTVPVGEPGMKNGKLTGVRLPNGTMTSACLICVGSGACTTVDATSENAPVPPGQLLGRIL